MNIILAISMILMLTGDCTFAHKCELPDCNPDPSASWSAPSGQVICKVVVKAGNFGDMTFESDGCKHNDGYCVSGIGTTTATSSRVCQEGPGCHAVSHVDFWVRGADPTQTPDPTSTQTPTGVPTIPTPVETPTPVIPSTPTTTPIASSTPVLSVTPAQATSTPTAEERHATPNPWPTPISVPVTGGGGDKLAVFVIAAPLTLLMLAIILRLRKT